MRQNIATFGEGAKFFNESRYEKLAKLEAERTRQMERQVELLLLLLPSVASPDRHSRGDTRRFRAHRILRKPHICSNC